MARLSGEHCRAAGLHLGIYGDAGTATCAGCIGSLGYEQIDATQFAAWAVDLLKLDNCYAPPVSVVTNQRRYEIMRDALNATGQPIVFSMCESGISSPWLYGQQVCRRARPSARRQGRSSCTGPCSDTRVGR